MAKKEIGNRGSATVEMTIIMPFLVSVCLLVIFLFLDSVFDAKLRGEAYNRLYTFDGIYPISDTAEKLERQLAGMVSYGLVKVDARSTDKEVFFLVRSDRRKKGVYQYVKEAMRMTREQGVCSDRLRRWQFYGDIIWE